MIVIPALPWRAVVEEFAESPGMTEHVAFLDGVASGPTATEGGIVTTVTFPLARESAGHWEVGAVEMATAGRHLRGYDLVRLCQIHSHPGPWTGHSEIDDEQAFSQAPGTLSIVLPVHGLTYPGLGDVGVHRRERDGWRELQHDEVARYLKVVPSLLDHRRPG